MQIAYLLTGSNIGERAQMLNAARRCIYAQCGEVRNQSLQYETEPWGVHEQNHFLNQALELHTVYSPQQLIKNILKIEIELGRKRQKKYGPRTIDIDILFYNDHIIHEPGLDIPHPQLHLRRFALQCMNDIAPHLLHPKFNKTIAELLTECPDLLEVKIWK
jgi:2-amino-4-hydroxy-6-hydroxymethyldihydropteridine diphosphokinase